MRVPCVSKPLQKLCKSAPNAVWEEVDISIKAASDEDYPVPTGTAAPSSAPLPTAMFSWLIDHGAQLHSATFNFDASCCLAPFTK